MHCAIERIKKYYGYSLSATFFKSLKMCLTICEEISTYRLIKSTYTRAQEFTQSRI